MQGICTQSEVISNLQEWHFMNHFPNIFYQILNYQTARVKFWILIVDLIYASSKLNVLKTQNWWVEMNETKIQYDICTPSILRQDGVDITQISINLQTFVYTHCSCSCMIHVGRCVDDTFTFYTIHLDADTATACRLTQVCRRPATWKYFYLQLSLFWFRSLLNTIFWPWHSHASSIQSMLQQQNKTPWFLYLHQNNWQLKRNGQTGEWMQE